MVTKLEKRLLKVAKAASRKPKFRPPTLEDRLDILYTQRDDLRSLLVARKSLGEFDANAAAIRETLQATLDIIEYLISLNERDKGRGHEGKRQVSQG